MRECPNLKTPGPESISERNSSIELQETQEKRWTPSLILTLIGILVVVCLFWVRQNFIRTYQTQVVSTPTPRFFPTPTIFFTLSPTAFFSPPPLTSPTSTPAPSIRPKRIEPFDIKIIGDGDFVDETNQALDLLKNKASIHYDVVVRHVGVIELVESGSGMWVWEDPPLYKVGKATVDSGTIWYAGTIAHDACHSKQYHDYLLNNPSSFVPSEVYKGRNAEAQCLDVQYDALTKIGASQKTLDYIKNVIDSEYWDIDYDERWW